MPAQVPVLLAPGTRISFTRDSSTWSGAYTLADLLERVPGVYVARTGFDGLPAFAVYAGRGASAIEIYWDGVKYEPLGQDSVYVDPATIPLTLFTRIDIEITPAVLRIYLVSERHDRLESRSEIHIVSGDFSVGSYSGLFQKRWPNGLGVTVAADFMSTDGASGPARSDQRVDLWLKGEWIPDASTGVSYQVRRQHLENDPVPGITAPVGVHRRVGNRTDFRFEFYKTSRADGTGLRLDLGVFSSSWVDDSTVVDSINTQQQVRSAFAALGYNGRTVSLQVRARVSDRWLESELESRLVWMPVPGIMLSGFGRTQRYSADRVATRLEYSLSLYRGPFSLVGTVNKSKILAAPSILTDSVVPVDDASISIGVSTGLFRGSVRYLKRDGFNPRSFPLVPLVASFDSTAATDFVEARATLRLASFFTIGGWYSHPQEIIAFQPPNHGRVDFTFYSRYWKKFRSGAFALMFRVSLNSWSRGTAGLDDTGTPIELSGISFWETHLQFRIVGFNAFWNLRNAYNAREDYVPGLAYPTNAQTFGVKWEFTN